MDKLKLYACAPFAIVDRILQKIENEKAEVILIVPIFTIQVWFPKVAKLLIRRLVKLPATCKSLYFYHNLKVEPNLPKIQLMACFISGNI